MSSASSLDFPQIKVIIFLYSLSNGYSSIWSLVADKNEKSININEKFILTRQTAQKKCFTWPFQDKIIICTSLEIVVGTNYSSGDEILALNQIIKLVYNFASKTATYVFAYHTSSTEL